MATNYPGGLDSLSNPSAGSAQTSPSHAGQHTNANDAIEAIQGELGTDPSGSAATVRERLEGIEAGTRLAAGGVTSDSGPGVGGHLPVSQSRISAFAPIRRTPRRCRYGTTPPPPGSPSEAPKEHPWTA